MFSAAHDLRLAATATGALASIAPCALQHKCVLSLTEEHSPKTERLQCWVIIWEEDLAQGLAQLGVDLQIDRAALRHTQQAKHRAADMLQVYCTVHTCMGQDAEAYLLTVQSITE